MKESIFPVKWSPVNGGVISDLTPDDMRNGGLYTTAAYTGGVNIRAVGKGTNVSPAYEPIDSYDYLDALEEVEVQNKIFRINVDNTNLSGGGGTIGLGLYTPSGQGLHADGTTPAGGESIADILADIKTLIDTWTDVTPVTSVTTTGANTGYVTVEYTEPEGYDFIFISAATGGLDVDITVTQEAVDVSMLGEWKMLGSNNRVGDNFSFWTTRTGEQQSVVISGVVAGTGNVCRVTTTTAHGRAVGEAVNVTGVDAGATVINGIWIVSAVISATVLELALTTFTDPYVSGGTLAYNIYGLGEIGVVYRTAPETDTYTRLLRSRELAFAVPDGTTTRKQIDVRNKRKQDNLIANYFTDKYNVPRVFYYKGDYITDGAVTAPDGQYSYGTIAQQLIQIDNSDGLQVAWQTQQQSGGNIFSGNWRYAVRGLDQNFNPSPWSLLTEPAPAFTSDNSATAFILGDEENIATPKVNVLTVTNNNPGRYKFCEIAAVNYVGSAIQAYNLGRYSLNGDATQTISHTGNEVGVINIDPGDLNVAFPGFRLAENVELCANRLIYSNLIANASPDFTEFTEQFRYSLNRFALDPVGVYNSAATGLDVGEYQYVTNTNQHASHMIGETYRYAFVYRLKDGSLTPAFYPGYDIPIDLSAQPAKDAGTFVSYDTTDGAAGAPTEVYSIYIDFHDANLNTTIDGVPVYDLITHIIPVRVPITEQNRTAFHGLGVMGVDGELTDGPAVMLYGSAPGSGVIGAYPYIVGTNLFTLGFTNIASSNNPIYPDNFAATRENVFFFCPDQLYGQSSLRFSSGDTLISLGSGFAHSFFTGTAGANGYKGVYAEYTGFTDITADPTPTPLLDGVLSTKGQMTINLTGGVDYSNNLLWDDNYPSNNDTFLVEANYSILTDAAILNTSPNLDYGAYQMIYKKALTDQYGADPSINTYETVGVEYAIGTSNGQIASGEIEVSGDCFTQKTYLKQRYAGDGGQFMAACVGFYSQNRANVQLRNKPFPAFATLLAPEYPLDAWVSFYVAGNDPQLNYNKGYTYKNGISALSGYNSDANYQLDWGNMVAWSDADTPGSQTDNNNLFPATNIVGLDYSFGPITDLRVVNGEIITLQTTNVVRQYFDSAGQLASSEGQVNLGSTGLFSPRGKSLTGFGCQHKWSVAIGKSDKGFDVLYFLDWTNKTFCRYGYNGVDSLDEINGMKSFLANNLSLAWNKDTPCSGQGIFTIPNQRYREILMTVRAINEDVEEWDTLTDYAIGDVVRYVPAAFTTFEQTGEFYRALTDGAGNQPDISPDDWEVIDHTDPDYYNEYTLVFSELKNAFQAFHTPKPLMYGMYKNGFICPRPVSDTGRIYKSGGAFWTTWFDDDSTVQTAPAYFDAVINYPMGRKRFKNVRLNADAAPEQMTVTTKTGYTYSDTGDFVQREGNEFDAPVKNDATVTVSNPSGLPTENTSSMRGWYGIFRFIITEATYNKIESFVAKCTMVAREFQK